MANNNTMNMPLSVSSTSVTKPLQTVFCTKLSADQLNVTGGGSTSTIHFDSEYFDIGNNFNTGTYTFTAPTTGVYIIGAQVTFSNVPTPTSCQISLVTTLGVFDTNDSRGQYLKTSGNLVTYNFLFVVPMTATDTAYVRTTCSGSTDTMTVASGDASIFWGYLAA